MIKLFNINNYQIDTAKLGNLLHGEIVEEFEQAFAEYVGAKYACFANSASSLIYLSLKGLNSTIKIPSIIPLVIPNVIINSGNNIEFYDDIDWVGSAYKLHDGIWDSAQQVTRNQYKDLANPDDVMIFSFYPTKPIGSCDGGMVVGDNKDKIDHYRTMALNGTKMNEDNWNREHVAMGYKMHGNSLQAYMANENLKKLDEKNSILEEIRLAYNDALGYNNTSNHLYRVRVKDNRSFLDNMKDQGIQCGIHYAAFHKHPLTNHCHLYLHYRNRQPLKKSELEEQQTVSIPFHEQLKNKEIEHIIENIKGNKND
tara:strand:+ start:425 stop:1360 length:936 start_codon:yes stop_codon:yes gene_type:complete